MSHRVTILTDASYCNELKVGGYGFWVATSEGSFGGGGPLKGTMSSVNGAEMAAICNALHQAIVHHKVRLDCIVLIQTDSLAAIYRFKKSPMHRLTEFEAKCVDVFDSYVKQFNLAIDFRHVKAHTGRQEARYVANAMCDKRAKKGMRDARNLMRLEVLKAVLDQTCKPLSPPTT